MGRVGATSRRLFCVVVEPAWLVAVFTSPSRQIKPNVYFGEQRRGAAHRRRGNRRRVGGRLRDGRSVGCAASMPLQRHVERQRRRATIEPRLLWWKTLNEADPSFVVLVTPAEVKAIAGALAGVTESWLRSRYTDVPFPGYQAGEKSEEDWQYTIGNFEGLPEFFNHAAREGRYVTFHVGITCLASSRRPIDGETTMRPEPELGPAWRD